MKTASIVIVVLLALAIVGETIFMFQQFSIQQNLSSQLVGLQQKIGSPEKDKSKLEGEKSAVQVELGKFKGENEALSTKIVTLEGEAKTATKNMTDLTKKLEDKTSAYNKLENENLALNRKLMCKNPLTKVDFSSNKTVNEILTSYVRGQKNLTEPVSAHYWNLVWTDSKYSIHSVEVNSDKDNMVYLWKFTVYFKGESYGNHVNGIFYNDDQCWLYLDK